MEFPLSPKALRREIIRTLAAGNVPYVAGPPGVGKSALFHSVANEFNIKVIDLRLSQCTPEDLQGFPSKIIDEHDRERATFVPFNTFPVEGDPLPDGYNGWMLILDELPSAPRSVIAAAYKLILDRMVGQHKLHDDVYIVSAGNRMQDGAISSNMGSAMTSRLIQYEMEVSADDWLEWAEGPGQICTAITGYIHWQKAKLHVFDPNRVGETFPCPRTWQMLDRYLKALYAEQGSDQLSEHVLDEALPSIAGCIGAGEAVGIKAFVQEWMHLPKLADVLADPEKAKLPTRISAQYATVAAFAGEATKDNLGKLAIYFDRFSPEHMVVFFRQAFSRDPGLREVPAAATALAKMARVLNGIS